MNYFKKALEVAEEPEARENLDGWLQRARSAHLRQKRLDREAVVDSILNQARQLVEKSEFEAAVEFLNQKKQEYENAERLERLLEKIRLKKKFRAWLSRVEGVDADSSSERVGDLISSGEKYLKHDQLRDTAAAHLGGLYFYRGSKLVRTEADRAREYLLRARALAREARPEIFHQLARSFYNSGQYVRAEEYLLKIRRKFPGFEINSGLGWRVWLRVNFDWLVVILLLVGLVAGVIFVLVPVFGGRMFTWVGQKLAPVVNRMGFEAGALYIYDFFCDPGLMSAGAFGQMCGLIRERDDYEKLLTKLQERRSSTGLSPVERLEFGRALLEVENLDSAHRELSEVYCKWEDLVGVQKQQLVESLAPLKLRRGKIDAALEMFKRLLDEVQASGKLYEKIVKIAAGTGDWDTWEETGREWLERSRGSYIQSAHRKTLDATEADAGYQDPESIAGVIFETYDKNCDLGYPGETLARLEFLLELAEEKPGTEELRNELLREILSRDLDSTQRRRYIKQRAELCEKQRNYDEAIELYEELTTGGGSDMDLLEKLGRLYREVERRDEAVECYQRLFELQQDNAAAIRGLRQLGREYEERDRYPMAEQAYRSVLQNTRTDNPEVKYRLAVALYRQGERPEALSVLQKIKGGAHEFQGRVLAFMGRCLVELEMYEVAAEKISEFEYNDPELPSTLRHELRYWLARADEARGELDRARRQYQNVYASDVEFRDVASRLEELKNEQ